MNYKIFSHFSANNISLVPFPFTTELAMEAYIWENPEVLKLSEDDHPEIHGLEVKWNRGDKGGRIDILASYNDKTLAIVELKNGELNQEHLKQLECYFKSDKYLSAGSSLDLDVKNPGWIGILMGTGITSALRKEIEDGKKIANNVSVGAVIINRFKGGNQSFIISDTIPPKTGKDYSRYSFMGAGSYPKNRVIFALVQRIISDNEKITFKEVSELFNKKIHFIKSKPLFKPKDEAVNDEGYYFVKPNDFVSIEGFEYAVLNWWAITDMEAIKEIASSRDYEIKRLKDSK